ncbi:hypothetical protein BBK36DRAFT_1201401 [Trichoderma citrinoviride]|uniref:Uncharacterized protein n=1 Tax=Trichoderma citrinoviride TaxID=58853 RepID=A0A2T4BB86_9HYPO|nr:hypothetical protein BBK36DRAFT_1201401 [Trichoderma citrinoviride]PTB66501.1 hypothetical protein BBK36DRAFT_1201401 [Trichoderma citrinoviride]
MSRERLAMTALAGVGVVGATIYATRRGGPKTDAQDRRDKAQETRELGLGSAGVGGNRMAGGPSNSAAPSGPERDPADRQVTSSDAKGKLPSGGVGGGEAGSKSDHSKWPNPANILGSTVQKTGPRTASREDAEGHHDTRGISKMGPEVETKRGPADATRH